MTFFQDPTDLNPFRFLIRVAQRKSFVRHFAGDPSPDQFRADQPAALPIPIALRIPSRIGDVVDVSVFRYRIQRPSGNIPGISSLEKLPEQFRTRIILPLQEEEETVLRTFVKNGPADLIVIRFTEVSALRDPVTAQLPAVQDQGIRALDPYPVPSLSEFFRSRDPQSSVSSFRSADHSSAASAFDFFVAFTGFSTLMSISEGEPPIL